MAGRTPVNARDNLERLIVIKISQYDLIDALRGIHEIEYRRITERRDDYTGIQCVQAGLEARVVRQHRLHGFLDVVPLANVFIQLVIGRPGIERQLFRLRLIIVHPLLGLFQFLAELFRVGLFVRESLLVLVFVAVVNGFGEPVILVSRIVLRVEITQLLLDFVDLRFVLLLLCASLLELLLQLLELGSIERRGSLLNVLLCPLNLKAVEVALVRLPFTRIINHDHGDGEAEKQKAGYGEPLVKVNDFVKAIAPLLDIQRGNFLCRRWNGRPFVTAVVGSFAAHISLLKSFSNAPRIKY